MTRPQKPELQCISIFVQWSVFTSALLLLLASCGDTGGADPVERDSADASGGEHALVEEPEIGRINEYAGTQACAECHAEIVATYAETAHHNTSRTGERKNVLGQLVSAHNTVKVSESMHIRVSQRGDTVYQVAIFGEDTLEAAYRRAYPIDIAFGSGRKGQTYLTWRDDSLLFQMPISYYTVNNSWVVSPGYTHETIGFDRPVVTRCVECHATYFESRLPWEIGRKVNKLTVESIAETSAQEAEKFMSHRLNAYEPGKYILGLTCEKCHNPGRQHVEYHRKNPRDSVGRHIVATYGHTSDREARERSMDLCAWCHSGVTDIMREPFSYRAGMPLDSFFLVEKSADPAELDVHGNQAGLLRNSKCFSASGVMTCTTCHDPHKKQRDLALFNSKCQTCHTDADCGMHGNSTIKKHNVDLGDMCVDCHMPQSKSRSLLVEKDAGDEAEGVDIRTHYIAIYPSHSDAILKRLEAAH